MNFQKRKITIREKEEAKYRTNFGATLVQLWCNFGLVHLGKLSCIIDLRFSLPQLNDESAADFYFFPIPFFRLGSRDERDVFPFYNELVYAECAIAPTQI